MFSLANTTNLPNSIVTTTSGITQVDSRGSSSGGVLSGGTSGMHKYDFTTNLNVVDVSGGETPLTIVAGGNATESGGIWSKSITGTAWNSSVRSTEQYSTGGIWAISWEIMADTGTIRQMSGISENDLDTYQSCTHAAYQVNGYFYSTVYESGSGKSVKWVNQAERHIDPGDRFGVMISGSRLRYFVMKGTNVHIMHVSETPVTGTGLRWKGVMNRGTDASGHSQFGDVWYHDVTSQISSTSQIRGYASDALTQEHIDSLLDIGMIVQAGSTYANLIYIRSPSTEYEASLGVPYDIDMTHSYEAILNQDVKTITH